MDNQMLPKSYGRQREEHNRANKIRAAENKTQTKYFVIANTKTGRLTSMCMW